ncbi:DUF1801 domain-containing protein [Thalassotalea sp. 1_MG-2023]|uniref:DUF1801 domain-containing protein n=1 Tax=Thalassotalea sp. 1_MG-2023 TaxID=3062680 RepID=UPI0026E2E75B|nr:DUF1801 domain-containing protein [Thalassotalea sp. 1_MG-2023]MDO6427766.1 DUF1801 domain-containing protein [Thalassotalea sp. 1_MG-2023]
MTEIKTQPNQHDVHEFLSTIDNEVRKEDAHTLLSIFTELTGFKPVMWGSAIIGFGQYQYHNSKGTNKWMLTGFSPRKQNLSLYIMQGFDHYQDYLKNIGKVKTAKSCLYINRLDKVDMEALTIFLQKSIIDIKQKYPDHTA